MKKTIRRFHTLLLIVVGLAMAVSAHASIQNLGSQDIIFSIGNTSSTLAERMRITSGGLIGISNSAPAYTLDVVGAIRAVSTYTNTAVTSMVANNANTTTSNGNYSNTGLYANAVTAISSGVTNSGNVIGASIGSFNQSAGNLASLYGINVSFGGNLGTGTITNAYGIVITSYQASGTTTAGFGLFIQDIKATNGYGIYQTGTDDSNYFAGNVGIGKLPGSPLDVSGSVTATSYFQSSDARLKTNIETAGGLAVVDKLRGVTFEWKNGNKPSAGVIAQEVESVMPSAVASDKQGIKSVNYDQLIAPLIEAVKELHRNNQKFATEVKSLRTEVEILKKHAR